MTISDRLPDGANRRRKQGRILPLLASYHQSLSPKMITDMMALADMALIVIAAIIAKYIYIDGVLGVQGNDAMYALPALFCAVLSFVLMRKCRLYESFTSGNIHIRIGGLFSALCLAFLLLIFAGYIFKISFHYSRIWIFSWFLLSFCFILAERLFARNFVSRLAHLGLFRKKVAIIGADDIGQELFDTLSENYKEVSVLGLYSDQEKEKTDKVGSLDELISFGQENEIDQVIIALPMSEDDRIAQIVAKLQVLPIDVQLCPARTSFRVPLKGIDYLGNVELFLVNKKPIEGWGYLFKSIADYILGAIAMVIFAPVFLVIAAAIKLDSPGPILFSQRRHGYNHQVIHVLKFRTMAVMEDGDQVRQAQKNDSRVTRVGRFLRKTSLDELPQLYNVLRGEMSLVGPRPHALVHNQYYSEMLERYANRHKVKPGITGWAQINGYRGPTDNPDDMRKRAELDLYYIDNWSLWMDFKILVATPLFGFVNRNAF